MVGQKIVDLLTLVRFQLVTLTNWRGAGVVNGTVC